MIIIEVAQAVQYVFFLPLSLALRGNGVSGVAKGFVWDTTLKTPLSPPFRTPGTLLGCPGHYLPRCSF